MNKILPKVSLVTITYGHDKYIEETLDGVLMQQYDGPIEFIIANDNSPDNTDAIIQAYLANHQIPDNFDIRYTCHPENKGMMPNFIWALKQATGKYIALCEGDDYWTDPLKLQKQVDFLEENPEYSCCFHRYKEIGYGAANNLLPDIENDLVINLEIFFGTWYTKTLTSLIRRNMLEFNQLTKYRNFRDTHLFFELLKKGNGKCFNWEGGTYNRHTSGIWSLQSNSVRLLTLYTVYEEIYFHNSKIEKLRFYVEKLAKHIVNDTTKKTIISAIKSTKSMYFKIYYLKLISIKCRYKMVNILMNK